MNTTLVGVPQDSVDLVWGKAQPLLERALGYADGEFTIEDVLKFILDRTMQLWVLLDAETDDVVMAATTEMTSCPRMKVCRVVLMGGVSMDVWQDQVPVFEDWARQNGCQMFEIYGRKGLAKKLTQLGYETKYYVNRKQL